MLILVRHGRTNANASGLLLGRLDPDLDDLGHAQATALGQSLSTAGITQIVSSPLARTFATASAISEAVGVPVSVDERWIELDYGEFDGRPLVDIPAPVWQAWRADPA